MQKIKLKDGRELISLELNKDRAVLDIVERFMKEMSRDVLLMREMGVNMPNTTGAIMLLRGVKEFVELDGCSEDFKELVKGQREFLEMLIGDRERKVVEVESSIVRPI